MADVVFGVLAIAVGALFCFRGYLTMRIVIPIWGAFAGFVLGAGFISSVTDEGFLTSALAWIVGLGVALVFGLLAYLYYEISVLLAMGAIGFVLGTSVAVALGATGSWVIVAAGIAAGVVFGIIGVLGDLPTLLLVVLTALAGASTIVGGIMLLVGTLDADEVSSATPERLDVGWWASAAYLVLAVVGIVIQLRNVREVRTSTREAWDQAGGRQMRTG